MRQGGVEVEVKYQIELIVLTSSMKHLTCIPNGLKKYYHKIRSVNMFNDFN